LADTVFSTLKNLFHQEKCRFLLLREQGSAKNIFLKISLKFSGKELLPVFLLSLKAFYQLLF